MMNDNMLISRFNLKGYQWSNRLVQVLMVKLFIIILSVRHRPIYYV